MSDNIISIILMFKNLLSAKVEVSHLMAKLFRMFLNIKGGMLLNRLSQ